MPIAIGPRWRAGMAGQLGLPGDIPGGGRPGGGRPGKGLAFRSVPFSTYQASVVGVTNNSTGSPLAACTVDLFQTLGNAFVASVVSDGSGNFKFFPTVSGPFYLVAYLAGAPDVAGTSVNTLIAS